MAKQPDTRVPEIRFKVRDLQWKPELLGTIYAKIRNAFVGTASPFYVNTGHFYLQSNNVKNGVINRNTEVFINDDFYLKQKDNWLHTNDIVVVQSGHVGHTAVIPEELDNTAAHALIIISQPLRKTDSDFVNFQFQTHRTKRQIQNITTGNTIKHILASDMKTFQLYFCDCDEQSQLGAYFKSLDRVIGVQQRKHDKLVALKKAMLQKMFPQPGAATPEIRFKGFSGEWEEKTLGELGKVATNKRIFMHQTSPTGDVPFYKIGTFGREPQLFISQSLFETYKERFPFPAKGDLLFSVIGSIGRVVEYTGKDEYFQDSNIVWLQHNGALVNSFLKQFYSIVKWSGLEGSTIIHLYNKNILGTKIWLPDKNEQHKIGTYFRTLDELISKHAIQLQKLKQIKSACLEKMFV